jgi:hypothetical protein
LRRSFVDWVAEFIGSVVMACSLPRWSGQDYLETFSHRFWYE